MDTTSLETKEESFDGKDTISFADLGLDDVALKAVQDKGFTEPTPIQVLAIPRLLNGDANVIAKARTGTGKTAAFGIPLVQELRADKHCPRALVLVPTRELAVQVAGEIDSLRSETYPRTATVYGGASIVDQLRTLRNGVEIVVGTPGRVIDHLERRSLDLSKIEYFILDEADEMLNMGFIEDIEAIFGRANPEARVLMFSATMPQAILSIASNFMGDYEIVEEENRPEEPILTEQFCWFVREDDKTEALVRLIDSSPDFYGLVFCQTKADADAVAKELDERHYQAAALHGDIAQSQREKILGRFRVKKTRILVATDVAARGIDIEGLTHVVNYALPYDGPTYTHRVGRTGRAGAKGMAITFVRPEERRRLGYLRNHARGELKEGQVPTVREVLDIKRNRLMSATTGDIARFFDQTSAAADAEGADGASPSAEAASVSVAPEFLEFAESLSEGRDPKEVLAAVLSLQYGDALSPDHYTEIKTMRNPGNDRSHVRLYLGLGRRDGMNRRGVAQFFRDLIGVPERLVDRIEVMDAFSLATLPADAAAAALDLSKQRRNVPHMHVDVKDSGGDFHSGPRGGNRRGPARGFGEGYPGGGFAGDGNARPRGPGYRGARSADDRPRDDRPRNDRPRSGHPGGFGRSEGSGPGRFGGGDRPDAGRRQARTYSRGPRPEGGAEAFLKRKEI
ncbi:DEAD/DEAH box helicase [Treponema zuelzerae]|uniref:DEAD/DEAH box helicase n=1 Tax=Teretinema zuelzerae TaxID=156 RepID=A0AAE3JJC8_9SPIR|nr:DEAD/DEAH box helicase [Teretinema zuelzerae]MCD1655378.1 DEAD/DEAH box helicase [Teretinema zuelzerae]